MKAIVACAAVFLLVASSQMFGELIDENNSRQGDGRYLTGGRVDADLRVRRFFHHGGTISIREFIVGRAEGRKWA